MKFWHWLVLCGVILLVMHLVPFQTVPLFWIPRSDSVRPGIYMAQYPIVPLTAGDIVVFKAPVATWAFLKVLGVDGAQETLMKHVAATPGQLACYDAGQLTIDGTAQGEMVRHTRTGVPVPQAMHGCHRIREGQFLPLSLYNPRSYDGRYFGPVAESAVVAKVWPLVYVPRWLYE